MPNWVYNTITVKGNKEDIAKMMNDAVKGENGIMNLSSWFPVPETFIKYDTTNYPDGKGLKVGEDWYDGLGPHEGKVTEELIEEFKQATKEQREKYGVVGWYDYNVLMYGCKWNSELNIEEQYDEEIVFTAETPWGSPERWVKRMSEKYPELTFHLYAEYEDNWWEDKYYQAGEEACNGEGTLWDNEEDE